MITEKIEKQLFEIFEDHNGNSKNILTPEEVINLVDSIKNKINQNSYEGKVFEFMANFKQDTSIKPHIPSIEDCKFRISLLLEELSELAIACGHTVISGFVAMMKEKVEELSKTEYEGKFENIAEAFDAYIDIGYVLFGGLHKFGFAHIYPHGFEIVHESNMSKLCNNMEQVERTLKFYQKKEIPVKFEETLHEGQLKYIIKRLSDNKVLKNIDYLIADFTRLLYDGL